MQIWDQFLETLEKDFGKNTIDKWLRSLHILRFDAANLHLEAQDSFQALWFEEHVREKAQTLLRNSNDRPIKIKIEVQQKKHFEPTPIVSSSPSIQFNPDSLDPLFSFENFILSEQNFLTFQIFSELVGFDPSTYDYDEDAAVTGNYNPIFVYGEEGSGKTHILSAATLAMQKQKINVLYVKTETFTEHMIKAMRTGQMPLFRNTYRNADVLIIDNVEHLANKTATQEEFFHTFNHYHTSGKQIILASNLQPKKLEKIEPRLISRFEWGVVLSLTELSQEKLPLFLLKKVNILNLFLSKELKDYLIHTFTKPAHLAKALEILSYKINMTHDVKHPPILHLDEAKKVLKGLLDSSSQQKLSPEGIIHAVSETFDMNKEEILGKSQTKDIVFPRQLAMYLLRNKLKMPYLKIGRVFSRDHSTVISSVKQITLGIKNKESKILSRLEYLEKKIAN